jgi:outer membrane protein assembly factor BamE (lipoprotein component of BamABCDE complex)
MFPRRRRGAGLALVVIAVVAVSTAGCGHSSGSTEQPIEVTQPPALPVPAPTPAPTPPPPRGAGARIADEESLKFLVQGQTTKEQVRERFGTPQEVILSPGVETFLYYRDRSAGWFSGTGERVEALTIRFDTKGVLKDFEYRYSGK